MATQISEKKSPTEMVITWEALPVEQIAKERQEKERLRNYLISQGIDPDNLP